MALNYLRYKGFNKLVKAGNRFDIPGKPLWLPMFGTFDEAMSFGLYIAAYFRRVVDGLTTRVTVSESKQGRGLYAVCSVQFPGLGREEGAIVCAGGDETGVGGECEGIIFNRGFLLPIRQHLFTAETVSGSRYVRFEDGIAFCRSNSSGPLPLAKGLYFAEATEADRVFKNGGELTVVAEPAEGLCPVYLNFLPSCGSRGLVLEAESFRLGTKVKSIRPA